jgi:trk system potassium uptake protein TrkA
VFSDPFLSLDLEGHEISEWEGVVMRVVFIGSSRLSVATARNLLEKDHEVVFIEEDRERIEDLAESMDCGIIRGDGTRPDILRESDPASTDVLFCLTDSDQNNIIASLVGRSQGFSRIITRIEDPEFDAVCAELGIQDTIVPTRTTAALLTDMARGYDVLQLSSLFKGDARLYTFITDREDAGNVSELDLPEKARVICFYRDGEFYLADNDTVLKRGDEAVILTTSEGVVLLREKHEKPAGAKEEGKGDNRQNGKE